MPRQMKDSGVEWIGIVPENWKCPELKHFVRVNNGKEIGTEVSKDDPVSYPVYGSGGVFKYTDQYMYDGTCVMFGRKGTLGKPMFVTDKFWTVDTMYYLTHADGLDAKFNYYQLCAFDWESHITQTALPSVVASEIVSCKFPMPPKDEQIAIAAYLDMQCTQIDSVLEQTRASIEEYKKLKQAVITRVVTKGVRGNRLMKGSGISWLIQIPEEWFAERGKNLFVETKDISETGEEELLTVSHITGVTPRSEKNVNMFMSESLVGYKKCHQGDIAANTMWMWQGAIGVSKYEGVISPSYNTYRQRNSDYEPDYLEYLLRIPPLVAIYGAYSTGITASRLRLYPDQFFSILFPVPPKEEQCEIVKYLNGKIPEMDNLIKKKEQFLIELDNYKKSMIYEYVTGKKEVPQS